MKISREQFEKAVEYSTEKDVKTGKSVKITDDELKALVGILENMKDEDIRNLNYEEVKKEMKEISSHDIAEKMLLRGIIDKLLNNP